MSETIALIAGIAAYLLYRKRVHRADNQKPPNTQIGQSASISRGLFSPVSALSDLDVPHLMQYARNGCARNRDTPEVSSDQHAACQKCCALDASLSERRFATRASFGYWPARRSRRFDQEHVTIAPVSRSVSAHKRSRRKSVGCFVASMPSRTLITTNPPTHVGEYGYCACPAKLPRSDRQRRPQVGKPASGLGCKAWEPAIE